MQSRQKKTKNPTTSFILGKLIKGWLAKSDSPLSLNEIIETGLEKGSLWVYRLALDVPHLSLPWDWNMHSTVFPYICLPVGQIQSSKTNFVIAEQGTQFSKKATRAGKGQPSYFSLCNPLSTNLQLSGLSHINLIPSGRNYPHGAFLVMKLLSQ